MEFLTNDKLVIVGAAGMIGSNMAQTALMMGLTSNLCLYDVFSPEGVAEEMRQSGFDNVNITATTNVAEAFKDAKYIISSGGAPRKQGMTREDLLKGNCEIAEQLGKDIKAYCPDVKHVVIIFNPADLTGLVTLLYSGLKPSQVTTLAGLDSTRLQSALAKKFGVLQSKVTGCATYGGHGEQMAVFGSAVKVDGKPLNDLIGTDAFTAEEWETMKVDVTKGGAKIIELRGRSSFQSPSYLSVEMIRAAMGSIARYAIYPIQDLLGFGSDCRMNTPSVAGGNWAFRFRKDHLTPELAANLRKMTELFGRCEPLEPIEEEEGPEGSIKPGETAPGLAPEE
jgi:malate dehydrogenase